MTEPIRVVVADDHPLFRQGVVAALQSADDIVVVGQASDADSALRVVCEELPDVVLLDVSMPGSGLQAAARIATACPATRSVMLTISEDEDDLLAAMKAGASGYLLKGVAADALADVVRSVHAGQAYVAPSLASGLLRDASRPRAADPLADLTPRERQVLELVASGLNNQEIAVELGLAEKTVKHYMTDILQKLHLRSRVEAALLAAKAGLTRENRGPR